MPSFVLLNQNTTEIRKKCKGKLIKGVDPGPRYRFIPCCLCLIEFCRVQKLDRGAAVSIRIFLKCMLCPDMIKLSLRWGWPRSLWCYTSIEMSGTNIQKCKQASRLKTSTQSFARFLNIKFTFIIVMRLKFNLFLQIEVIFWHSFSVNKVN